MNFQIKITYLNPSAYMDLAAAAETSSKGRIFFTSYPRSTFILHDGVGR